MNYCINDLDNECKSITYLENPLYCKFYNNSRKKKKDDIISRDYDIYTFKEIKNDDDDNVNKELRNIDENNKEIILKEKEKTKQYLTAKTKKKDESQKKIEWMEEESTTPPVYNCDGVLSTNPFCTKEYTDSDLEIFEKEKESKQKKYFSDCFSIDKINTIQEEGELYNKKCKKKYGNEYDYELDKKKCKNGDIQIRCKVNFENEGILNNSVLNNDKNVVEHFAQNEPNQQVYMNTSHLNYEEESGLMNNNNNNSNSIYTNNLFKLFIVAVILYIFYLIYNLIN